MSATFSTVLCASLLACPLVAQSATAVVHDDFNDGVIDPAWSISTTLGSRVFVAERHGHLLSTGSLLSQAPVARYCLRQRFPALSGDFQLDLPLSWHPLAGVGGRGSGTLEVMLQASDGRTLLSASLQDDSTTDGGRLVFSGPTLATFRPHQAIHGEAYLRLSRHGHLLSWASVEDGALDGGDLGAMTEEIAQVEICFRHEGFGSPPLTSMALDSLSLAREHSPLLSAVALSSSQVELQMNDLAPFQPALFLFSPTGPGPTPSPLGDLSVDQPIGSLPLVASGPQGIAGATLLLPPGASGRRLWFQGVAIAPLALSQGVALTLP